MLRRVFFYRMEQLMTGAYGNWVRGFGQGIYNSGTKMQGDLAHEDTIQPSLRAVALSDTVFPKLLDGDWVAPNATVVGDVELGEGSSVWFGAVLRGDKGAIKIGKNSIVQDRVQLERTTVGDSVFIGPNSVAKGATLESFSHVGSNVTLKDGVTVEGFGMVASGSVVPEGTTVLSG
jgi:carbonic anhydrase/acetyltransferase-like protein (isoleucine patch superfamily)